MKTFENLPPQDSLLTELSDHEQYAADSLVKTLASQDEALAWRESVAAFGESMPASLASYDPISCSWKTSQLCLDGDLEPFLETWPRSGMMRNGQLYPLPMWERRTSARGSRLLPTPLSSDNRKRGNISMPSVQRRIRIGKQVALSMLFDKNLCPTCVEGMMGFPVEWTKLNL